MCWITNREPECKVAERDIIALKVVEKLGEYDFLCPYYSHSQGFKYYLNEITPKVQIEITSNKIELNRKVIGLRYEIYQGYHSYVQGSIWGKAKLKASENVIYINGNPYYVNCFSSLCIVECTIPKGVKYYLNEFGEYVSEQIVINKILEKFEHDFYGLVSLL